MARFFVTGGTGFLGSHLVRELLRSGHRVSCLSRNPPVHDSGELAPTWIEAGLADTEVYLSALRHVDYVVHLAGRLTGRSREDYFSSNVHGTESLVAACREAGAPRKRFLHMSSLAAMGPRRRDGLLSEDSPCRPQSDYGESKHAGERVVLEHADAIPAVILRPTFVYGPGDRQTPVFLRSLLDPSGEPWTGRIGAFSLCHVSDVVRCCIMALKTPSPSGETYVVSHPEVLTWTSLRLVLEMVFEELIPEARFLLGPLRRLEANGDPGLLEYWACHTSKARSQLGFEARKPLSEAAGETIQSLATQGFFSSVRGASGSPTISNDGAVAHEVRKYILSDLLDDAEGDWLGDDVLLLEQGLVDSASVVTLVTFLEERFRVRVDDLDLFPENFASVGHIAAFVRRKLET